MAAGAPCRRACRNTSRGCRSALVAVPELTSCKARSRFRRLRQRTQHFSTARPAAKGSIRAQTFTGASNFSPGSCARSRIRRANSITAESSAALAGPSPRTRAKSAASHVAIVAKLPASFSSACETCCTGEPLVPVPMSKAKSSSSIKARGPSRANLSRGRSAGSMPDNKPPPQATQAPLRLRD